MLNIVDNAEYSTGQILNIPDLVLQRSHQEQPSKLDDMMATVLWGTQERLQFGDLASVDNDIHDQLKRAEITSKILRLSFLFSINNTEMGFYTYNEQAKREKNREQFADSFTADIRGMLAYKKKLEDAYESCIDNKEKSRILTLAGLISYTISELKKYPNWLKDEQDEMVFDVPEGADGLQTRMLQTKKEIADERGQISYFHKWMSVLDGVDDQQLLFCGQRVALCDNPLQRIIELSLGCNPRVSPKDTESVFVLLSTLVKQGDLNSDYEKIRDNNLEKAKLYAQRFLTEPLQDTDIFDLEKMLMAGISERIGQRTEIVDTQSGRKENVQPKDIETNLASWVEKVNSCSPCERAVALEKAAELICEFQHIHPTVNASGRIGHILVNIALVKMGQSTFNPSKQDNRSYVFAVTRGINDKQYDDLIALMNKSQTN